jgi:hypothetical protein
MILTDYIIEEGKSFNGGWSQPQVELLGVSWPPQSGWKKKLVGIEVDDDVVDKFLSLKNAHLQTKPVISPVNPKPPRV